MALQVDHITQLSTELLQSTDRLAFGCDRTRLEMLQKAWALFQALETPAETLLRMWMLERTTKAVVQVCFDLGLFKLLSEDFKDKVVGSAEVAEKSCCETALLVRLLRHLAAAGLISEAGPDQFHANALTHTLASKRTEEAFESYDRTLGQAMPRMAQYLSERNYRNPQDDMDTVMQQALGTKLAAFEYLRQDPDSARLFKSAVLSQKDTLGTYWAEPEFYPVQDRLMTGLKEGGVAMVDIGGGIGEDLTSFHRAHPGPVGARLVLQDTEQVLASADNLPCRIEKMPHDFFTEQPVKGARAYYLHHVFHDWSDEKCREILLALKPALIPGYSRVLVHDRVVPAQGAGWHATASDLLMMVGNAGQERTVEGIRALFASAGLECTGMWTRAPGEESIVEAILPE